MEIGVMGMLIKKSASIEKCLLILGGVAAALGAQADPGWFSGISALPLTAQGLQTDSATFGLDSLSFQRPTWTGTTNPGTFQGLSLGRSGLWSLGDKWDVVGRFAGVYSQGDGVSTPGLRSLDGALPYTMTGVGMQYRVTHNLNFQGGLDHYQLNYNRINGSAGFDLMSLGLRYGF